MGANAIPNPKGCSGVKTDCCSTEIPLRLTATITSISDCDCATGSEVILTYGPSQAPFWQGPGNGPCDPGSARWGFQCNGTTFSLVLMSNTVCVTQSSVLQEPSCNNPFMAEFIVTMGGITCCDDSPATVRVTIR
jgi:hypothetical protein